MRQYLKFEFWRNISSRPREGPKNKIREGWDIRKSIFLRTIALISEHIYIYYMLTVETFNITTTLIYKSYYPLHDNKTYKVMVHCITSKPKARAKSIVLCPGNLFIFIKMYILYICTQQWMSMNDTCGTILQELL